MMISKHVPFIDLGRQRKTNTWSLKQRVSSARWKQAFPDLPSLVKMQVGRGYRYISTGNTSIKQILMKPKDTDPKDSRSGLIYSYKCPQLDCNDEYIGETGRTLGERRKEHLKQPSHIHGHSQTMGHPIEDQNFNIIGREDWGKARTIKESIYIRVNNPTLDQNIGKYNLNHIWDRVLFNTLGLRLGSSQHPAAIQ